MKGEDRIPVSAVARVVVVLSTAGLDLPSHGSKFLEKGKLGRQRESGENLTQECILCNNMNDTNTHTYTRTPK